jgi:hypothetical protein
MRSLLFVLFILAPCVLLAQETQSLLEKTTKEAQEFASKAGNSDARTDGLLKMQIGSLLKALQQASMKDNAPPYLYSTLFSAAHGSSSYMNTQGAIGKQEWEVLCPDLIKYLYTFPKSKTGGPRNIYCPSVDTASLPTPIVHDEPRATGQKPVFPRPTPLSTAPLSPPPADYWFPGGVRLLGQAVNDSEEIAFPQNVEARNWFLGFNNTLSQACPATDQTQAEVAEIVNKVQMQGIFKPLDQMGRGPWGEDLHQSIFSNSMAFSNAYVTYASSVRADGSIRPEGPQDARLLAHKAGCRAAQRYLVNGIILILHSGYPPKGVDARQFLLLASPQFKRVLGYSPEVESAVMHMGQEIKLISQQITAAGLGIVLTGRYGSTLPFAEQSVINNEINDENVKGQKVVNCFYNSGHSYFFWFGSAPSDYDMLVRGQPNHPFRNLGRGAVSGCPANEDLARQQRERIDALNR